MHVFYGTPRFVGMPFVTPSPAPRTEARGPRRPAVRQTAAVTKQPADDVKSESWLLLMHQIPPKPGYLRVKIWRRLQALGAVAIKNSVYALPNTDEAREDFEWVLREIVKEGGEATLCEARLVEGLSDEQVQRSFDTARDADYAEIADAARKLE